VIEFPGGDPSHARIYMGPLLSGPDASSIPVTLQFVDRHHDPHHPDMLLLFQGAQIVFSNQNNTFVAAS